MMRRLNIERILCIWMALIAAIALYGARGLPLEARYTLGPGVTPLFYSVLLIVSSAAVFLMARNLRPVSFKSLISEPGRRGTMLFAMFIVLSGLVYVLGFMVSIFLFTFAGLILIEDWAYHKALLFSIVWTLVLHTIFVRFLAARLIRGVLF
ncbi:MAG: hypothetical protein EA384_01975 [Spirochaetaceae bacterium]|nr:MAG: hypothetical protein EA384_01975 [Spirochaetaceae bacterium]